METAPPRLEPMTIGQLLDRTFRIYTSHAALMLGIVGLSYVPVLAVHYILRTVLLLGLGWETNAAPVVLERILSMLVLWLVSYPLAAGAGTYAVSEVYLGQPVSVGAAYREARQRWGTIINAQISVGLRIFLGFILCIIPGLIFMAAYAATVPVVMVERKTALQSMKRSWELSREGRRKAFNVLIVIGLITLVGLVAIGTIVSLLLPSHSAMHELAFEAGGDLFTILVTPLGIIASILLYYDFRIRKEGFDLEMLGRAFSGSDSNQPPIQPSAS